MPSLRAAYSPLLGSPTALPFHQNRKSSGPVRFRLIFILAFITAVLYLFVPYGLPQSFLFSKGNSNLDEIDSSPPEAAAPGVPENLAPVTLPVTLLPFQPPSPPVFRTAQEMATIPILEDLSAYVTPDKLLPPSLTFPWAHLGQNWPGIDWLNTEKSEKIDPKIPPRPKQSHLKAAFDYAARQHLQSSPPSLPNAIRYDSKNGRAILPSPPSSPNKSSYDLFNLEGKKALPKAQVESDNLEENLEIQEKRREYVKAGFLHSWNSYKEVWGHDEIRPISGTFHDGYNGFGATIFDSLSTLLIMNLSREYNLARDHVSAVDFTYLLSSDSKAYSTELPSLEKLLPPKNPSDWKIDSPANNFRTFKTIDWHSPTSIPLFETIIRYLGSMISAYDLSGDPLMLARAIELGDWILPAMNTEHGLPLGRYTFGDPVNFRPGGRQILSEVGSFSLEFTRLSQLSKNPKYFLAVERAMETLSTRFSHGDCGSLLPVNVDAGHPTNVLGQITFGALADSYIEYQIKEAQLLSDANSTFATIYEKSIDDAIKCKLIRKVEVVPGHEDLTVIGSLSYSIFRAELQHLTCFAGGMLALGSKLLGRIDDMALGVGVTNACVWGYGSTPSGLMAEILTFFLPNATSRYRVTKDGKHRYPDGSPVAGVLATTPHSQGRPETIESVFYMYRLTGDRKWQDKGWKMYVAWIESGISKYGMAGLKNVYAENSSPHNQVDSQESFVLAETFKYYYLLFSPHDLISLDDYVFNTEAHPLRIPKSTASTPPPSLWTGPEIDLNSPKSFISTIGEGSLVQLWGRISQAAALGHHIPFEQRKLFQLEQAELNAQAKDKPQPKFIRPSDKELADAAERGQ